MSTLPTGASAFYLLKGGDTCQIDSVLHLLFILVSFRACCRWHSPEDVELVQFMGKDNVPFHTVIFPATLLGSGQGWTMMKNISVTEYLNYEGGKFSKSRGTGRTGGSVCCY